MSAAIENKNKMEGKKFRFVVSSAEEAVKVIREQLGEHARVLTVEQIGGKGLARFLSSPQLEVIATLPTKAELHREQAKQKKSADSKRRTRKAAPVKPAPEPSIEAPATVPAGKPTRAAPRARRQVKRSTAAAAPPNSEKNEPLAEADLAKQRSEDTPLTPSGKETLNTILEKARFDVDLLSRMETNLDWAKISNMKLEHGLSEVFYWLRDEFSKLETQPIASRIAFLGTPGCGKTTSLCKRLANEVFVHGKKIQVLKVENDTPNSDDSLRVLCDILGIELLRDPTDLEKVDVAGDLYVDVPGVSLHEGKQWDLLSQRLDDLWVTTRVLVLNAAYEKSVIMDTIALADRIKCTHLVFTHLDELSNITKLWPIILNSGFSTLFFSYGQNVTSEFTGDVLEFMTSKTFPSYLTN